MGLIDKLTELDQPGQTLRLIGTRRTRRAEPTTPAGTGYDLAVLGYISVSICFGGGGRSPNVADETTALALSS